MAELFTQDAVQASFASATQKLGLTRKLEMSLSGTYYVTLCEDQEGREYIVKVRQKTSEVVKNNFHKEAALNAFFSKHHAPFAAPATVLFYDDLMPEVLAYTLVPGKALGWYYFYTGENQMRRLGAESLITALQFLNDNTADLQAIAQLQTATPEEMITAQQQYSESALAGGLSKHALEQCVVITKAHAPTWLKQPSVVHGDLNPKNVLATPDEKISFIDWSDAHCNGQYYDIAFLWLALWRVPDVQTDIVNKLEQPAEFWQMVTFWLPKFYAILHDVSIALNAEFAAGKIPVEAHDDNLRYVQQALHYYNERLERIFNQANS